MACRGWDEPDGEWSQAIAVSADGTVVVGMAGNGQGQQEAFRWTEADGMLGLGLLSGGGWSQANAASADGSVVVGTCQQEDGNTVSFIWSESAGMELLPPVGEEQGFYNGYQVYPQAVSDDGSLVVALGESDESGAGLVWERNHGWQTLQQRFEYLGMSPSMDLSYMHAIGVKGRNIVGIVDQFGAANSLYVRESAAAARSGVAADWLSDGDGRGLHRGGRRNRHI